MLDPYAYSIYIFNRSSDIHLESNRRKHKNEKDNHTNMYLAIPTNQSQAIYLRITLLMNNDPPFKYPTLNERS
jgi:hypothetical protein